MSNTRDSVSSAIQTPRSSSKNTPLHVAFSTLFSVFGYPDETLSRVFDILLQASEKFDKFANVTQYVLSYIKFDVTMTVV